MLYILGDLFEAWIGDDDPDPVKGRICDGPAAADAIAACPASCCTATAISCWGTQFAARTGCRLLPDPVIATFDEEPVLLTHGDALCVDDHPYQELRTTVRAAGLAAALPEAAPADPRTAGRARPGAAARRTSPAPFPTSWMSTQAAVEAVWRTGVSRIIHGHTHRPGIHPATFDGRAVERIVLGAWYEQGSYLLRESGRYELRELN